MGRINIIDMPNNYLIWDIASLAWTEIGIEGEEYNDHAILLRESYNSWSYIDRIIVRDVCGSFATISFTYLFVLIPIIGMLFITPMPDWGYDQEYLRKRMERWERRSVLVNFLNPFRLIGYPISLYFASELRAKLKAAFFRVESK